MKNENIKTIDYFKKMKNSTKILLLLMPIVIIILIIVWMKMVVFNNQEGNVSTISKSSLEKVIEINELSTVDYTYNAIVKVYDEDGETIKYYVAYEGIVTAGIDFEKINIEVNEEKKLVTITLPEVEIHDVNVNMGTMEYIFVKDKYETETVSQEAYKASKQDLEKRVNEETELHEMAKENAIASVKALFTPWIEQIDEEYTIEVY